MDEPCLLVAVGTKGGGIKSSLCLLSFELLRIIQVLKKLNQSVAIVYLLHFIVHHRCLLFAVHSNLFSFTNTFSFAFAVKF